MWTEPRRKWQRPCRRTSLVPSKPRSQWSRSLPFRLVLKRFDLLALGRVGATEDEGSEGGVRGSRASPAGRLGRQQSLLGLEAQREDPGLFKKNVLAIVEDDFFDLIRPWYSGAQVSITRCTILHHVNHQLSLQPCLVHCKTQFVHPVLVQRVPLCPL